MADGSIIIDTRIDTGGVSKGMNAVTLSVRNLLKCGLKPEKQESLLEKQKPIQSRNLLSMQRDRAAAMQKCFI